MKLNRRQLLAGSGAVLTLGDRSSAQLSHVSSAIRKGWNTLPLGAGGLVTGFHITPDGTMVCRTDVGNIYRWRGTTADVADPTKNWQPLLTFSSLGADVKLRGLGGWEHVLAPSKTTNHFAIFFDLTGAYKWWVFHSMDSGNTWRQTNLSLLNADPNGSAYKTCYYKMAVDPANENVVYCGMPTNSGNACSVYRAIDGHTFTALTTDRSTPFPQTTVGVGICGICFDSYYGATTVGGQSRTRRVIIPVGGVGVYESLDGGQTFTEVAAKAFGGSDFSVCNGAMNYYGVYYCVSSSATLGNHIWRYSGPKGNWTQIDPGRNWVSHGTIVVPDSRPSHSGFLNVTGPNGIGAGYTSYNADSGSPPTWGGRTGGEVPTLTAPSYDIGYLNYIFGQKKRSAFAYGTAAFIDANGVCWWSGNQSFWYFEKIPDYGASAYTTSVSVGRGMESTVAEDTICPPGGTYPVLAPQDLGVMRGTFTTYPVDVHKRYEQNACECLEYAASDPSFVVARLTGQVSDPYGDYSCYSTDYGADGTWTELAAYPTSLYQAKINGDISDGSKGPGKILNVTEVISGTVRVGQFVYQGNTNYGKIVSPVSGSGGIGAYNIDTLRVVSSRSLDLTVAIQGGQAVAVDHDHWVMVPSGLGQDVAPAYTANATSPSCSWALTNLPFGYWMLRGWPFGSTTRPLAVGYGSDLGAVWAVLAEKNDARTRNLILYRSTDYGATYSPCATVSVSVSIVGLVLLSVPGFPGELWLCPYLTGGAPAKLWHITHANSNAPTIIPFDGPRTLPIGFTLGAPASQGAYPALYGLFWASYGAPKYLYRGTYSGGSINWNLFGTTGTSADLPKSCQVCGIQSIRGDWNVYGRLYVASEQSGFAYHTP
jgi:hypothetical protein